MPKSRRSWIGLVSFALMASACVAGTTTELASLALSAEFRPEGGRVRARLTVTNLTSRPFHGTYAGVCAVSTVLRVAESETREWDQFRWFNSNPGGCKSMYRPLTVPPASSIDLPVHTNYAWEILGDSLPPGEYDGAIRIYFAAPIDSLVLVSSGRVLIQP